VNCPKKSKVCKPSVCFLSSKGNYICSGISKKPTRFKEDIVWLCLKGAFAKTNMEMTKAEALGIISVITASLFGIEKLEKEVEQIDKIIIKDFRKKNRKNKEKCSNSGS
jgi:hypothetical protein